MKYRIIALATLVCCFLMAVCGILYIRDRYNVKTVYVEGSSHYTQDQIKNMVMDGFMGDNSLVLSLRYKNKGIKDVPFIQTMDVSVLSPDTIRIIVYEKAMAGYIEYLGRYVYFDRDGIVVEAANERTSEVPQVTGLSFDHVVMHEPLEVSKPEVFADILDITQLMSKYHIRADRISFDRNLHKTLYFGEARVSLGANDNIGEKILKLSSILPQLEGRKGVLRMDNYSDAVRNITFEVDEPKTAA